MSITGTLDVVVGGTKTRYEWNGNVEDREAARAAFNEAITGGATLASVTEAPRQERQVSSFDEVEQIEKERGTVAVTVRAPLVGG